MRILIILMSAALGFASTLAAQQVKIGFVQVERVMQDFPEWEDALKTFEKELESWQMQLNEYESEIQSMMQEFEQRAMLYSPERKQEEQEKILEKRQEAVKFYQDVFAQGGKAEQRRLELLNPAYDKINRAIEILGEREEYSMVFNAQGLLFAKQEFDLTEEVLKILKTGVEVSPSGSRSSGGPRR